MLDDDDEEVLERKVAELDRRIAEDPYNYDDHIELIQALWSLSELDRWREAFERLQQMSALKAEHWRLRLQTEETLAHSQNSRDRMAELFQQAMLDCYCIRILSDWCSWALSSGDAVSAREQIDEVLRRAGADPLSGKIFWDAKLELEKAQLATMSEDDSEYKTQQERVLWCLEETVSRPLLRADEAWHHFEQLASEQREQEYVDKVKKQHEAAMDYLQKITPYEDKLLTLDNPDEKFKVYQDYIETLKELANDDKYAECDNHGILKVVYDRATSECLSCAGAGELLLQYARAVHAASSRASYWRVLQAAARRKPAVHTFWTLQMHQAEHEERDFEEVKSIFETALSKGMESYKQAESLWMSYLEYIRRRTSFDNEADVERLRRTFRLAWDALAAAWGEEANDCEVPLYWARLEYKFMNDPKQGREIFEELFKYGENKTMCKYWEALIQLEMARCGGGGASGGGSENKLRALLRRALRSVRDYPPALARLWTDYERDCGALHTARECYEACELKLKEWRESYQAMKDKMIGNKQKGKQIDYKKAKFDNKKNKNDGKQKKGKRKSDGGDESGAVKKKKDTMEVDEEKGDGKNGIKRSHEEDNEEETESKRQRRDESTETLPAGREACTLFVSNLDFKVNEDNLNKKLSEFGDIVSLRLKSGVKAFGGSICYCQYKTPESVDAALKHDRSPLDGRPMFLSRYAASKAKPTFKYPTTAEKNKLFVRNLPYSHCNKDALKKIFDVNGHLKDIRVVTFKDGKPKGLAYIEYDDEKSAAEALSKTDGLSVADKNIQVALSAPPPRDPGPPGHETSLGQGKRDAAGGRRTQLSSFIPSVLQKASTSKAANGNHSNGDNKRPLSNSDFRSMLLKK
ncbi:hypothetical protein O3G_MSEX002619 [Manduca sexta]|uniref:RRM domain-containing protein n=1 Tax=Manduca sexta TaxID=7130 RepID=A0A922CE99_MANSE|nr:hypothetical protein O3G_MSEX002619 [Manduca sexta]